MEWSNSRELLAVAGTEAGPARLDPQGATYYNNLLRFYTETGTLMYTTKIPNSSVSSHLPSLEPQVSSWIQSIGQVVESYTLLSTFSHQCQR